MEAILSHIRTQKLIPNSSIIDNLLNGIDLVNTLLENIETSDKKDISDIISSLNDILENAGVVKSKGVKTTLVPLVDIMGKYLDEKIDEDILSMLPPPS